MKIYEKGLYHIYNTGNNKQPIFLVGQDYEYFIELCHKYLKPRGQILAWCLMPNQIHFLVEINEISLQHIKWGGNEMPAITNGFQLLQSSYAKQINYREKRTGSLFQQKTKAKLLETLDDARSTFRYIHQNPVMAGLVKNMQEWENSSFTEYCGWRESKLCDVASAKNILGLLDVDFETRNLIQLNEPNLDMIF